VAPLDARNDMLSGCPRQGPRRTDEGAAMSLTYVEKLQQLRRSGAAGTHADRHTRRQRTRGAAKRKAIQETGEVHLQERGRA